MTLARRLALWAWMALGAIDWAHAQAQSEAEPGRYRDRPLNEVIDELRAAGHPLVYSTSVLTDELRVVAEPSATEPLALVRELLAPHGLGIEESGGAWLVVRDAAARGPPTWVTLSVAVVDAATGEPIANARVAVDPPGGASVLAADGRAILAGVPAGRHLLTAEAPGYLRSRLAIDVGAGRPTALTLTLANATPRLEELTVTASRYDLVSEVAPSSAFFTREEIEGLADLGDDPIRIAHRLPGVAAAEFSARPYVRGGDRDEMAIFFDGMELAAPFHLRDYEALFSVIDPRVVAGIQIYSGGFPVAYGGALSGLTVVEGRAPTERRQHEIGLSLLYTSFLSSGRFGNDRGEWVASARRGNLDQWLKSDLGEPRYRDAYGRVAWRTGKHELSLSALSYDDDVVLVADTSPGAEERSATEADAAQVWWRAVSQWSDTLSSRSVLSSSRVADHRRGLIDKPGEIVGRADDRREMSIVALRQDWTLELSERQLLSFGGEVRSLDAEYAYAGEVEWLDAFAALAGRAGVVRNERLTPSGRSYGAYFSDRVRLGARLVADIGVRWDEQTYLPSGEDDQFSPRLSLLYRAGDSTDLRLSYGRFFQPEALVDLPVQDGVGEFAPAQDASHAIASVEHRFANAVILRAELFRKITRSARARYENLFDSFVVLPELRPDRVRIAPERGEARGVELFVTGERPFGWWAAYTWSEAEDLLAGERVPRSWDQRHAVSGGVTLGFGAWTLGGSATYHSGWPTTDLSLQTLSSVDAGDEAQVVIAGARNRSSLDALRRVDLTAYRSFAVPRGSLRFFVDVTNLTNRRNPRGLEHELVARPDGGLRLASSENHWLPLVVNVGARWEF